MASTKSPFWSGFEKRAYDYAWEAQELEGRMKGRAKETPVDPKKSSTIGGLGGAGLGALYGARVAKSSLTGGLVGAAAGGLLGAGAGFLYHLADVAGVDHAKKVMKMDHKERKSYLASMARKMEIGDEDYKKLSRKLEEDRKHRELIGAIRGNRR